MKVKNDPNVTEFFIGRGLEAFLEDEVWVKVNSRYVSDREMLVISFPRGASGSYYNVFLGNDGNIYVGGLGAASELRVGDLVLERAHSLFACQE